MIRKRDEGYVLAFVLVVIVVICLVAVSMMTVSLRNLEAQTASVERMQDKYQVLGLMEEKITSVVWNTVLPYDPSIEDAIAEYLRDTFSAEGQSGRVSYDGEGADFPFTADFTLSFKSEDNSSIVNVSILWTGKIADNGSEYIVSDSEVIYTSYEVVSAETEVGE